MLEEGDELLGVAARLGRVNGLTTVDVQRSEQTGGSSAIHAGGLLPEARDYVDSLQGAGRPGRPAPRRQSGPVSGSPATPAPRSATTARRRSTPQRCPARRGRAARCAARSHLPLSHGPVSVADTEQEKRRHDLLLPGGDTLVPTAKPAHVMYSRNYERVQGIVPVSTSEHF